MLQTESANIDLQKKKLCFDQEVIVGDCIQQYFRGDIDCVRVKYPLLTICVPEIDSLGICY